MGLFPNCSDRKRFLCAFKILAQQLMKGMSRAVPVQDFPGPIVEHRLDPLDLASGELMEPSPFGEELAEQPIGVLVRAPLPGTLGVRKIDAHLRLLRGHGKGRCPILNMSGGVFTTPSRIGTHPVFITTFHLHALLDLAIAAHFRMFFLEVRNLLINRLHGPRISLDFLDYGCGID